MNYAETDTFFFSDDIVFAQLKTPEEEKKNVSVSFGLTIIFFN